MIAGPSGNGAGGGRAQRKGIAMSRCDAHPGDLRVINPSARIVDHAQQKQGGHPGKHGDQQANEGHPDSVGIADGNHAKQQKQEQET